ncbi:MAG TPA: universal stress protein [Solirubrobacterales bacterium]|jgi:nucleotide-binding universal stress UspA family protein|nr:universal stress protein [Solirubrobacterales bacterium]
MRVLVGFDGSDGARDAVKLARSFCASKDDEVLLVNVVALGMPLPVSYRLLSASESAEARELFLEPRKTLADRTVQTRTYASDSPTHVIADITESGDVDLVVVGSPHRGPVGRTVLGSVAEGLLHGSSVPIAVAPRGYADRGPDRFEVIAVAYDGSAESRLALRNAEAIAGSSGAKIRVLTVFAPAVPMPSAFGYPPPLDFDVEGLIAEALGSIDPGIEAEADRLAGAPASALADACETGVDILLAGSRGYGVLGRVFVGSVTSALICKAPCPVLVIPRCRVTTGDPHADPARQAEQQVPGAGSRA